MAEEKKRSIDRVFCKHPPWLKIPLSDVYALRSAFSSSNNLERCLILDIEDACYYLWSCGELIGERWKELAEEILVLFIEQNPERYEKNQILKRSLKTKIERYTQFYAQQCDLSINQSIKKAENGSQGGKKKAENQGSHNNDNSCEYPENSSTNGDLLDVCYDFANGLLGVCQTEEEEEEEQEKEEEGNCLIQDSFPKEEEKDKYIRNNEKLTFRIPTCMYPKKK